MSPNKEIEKEMNIKERYSAEGGLLTVEEARLKNFDFSEPEPRACPWCGRTLEPLGILLGGIVRWVTQEPCGCEGEKHEQERLKLDERARAETEMAQRVAYAGVRPRYANAQTSHPELRRFAEDFASNKGDGLYIHGRVGSGKTTAVSALARAFVYSGYSVVLTTTINMLDDIKASYTNPQHAGRGIDAFGCCDLLFLDDLGKENANSWAMTTLFQVINYRYERLLPMVATSQYAPKDIQGRLARAGERETAEAICSRMHQMLRPVNLGNIDHRRHA